MWSHAVSCCCCSDRFHDDSPVVASRYRNVPMANGSVVLYLRNIGQLQQRRCRQQRHRSLGISVLSHDTLGTILPRRCRCESRHIVLHYCWTLSLCTCSFLFLHCDIIGDIASKLSVLFLTEDLQLFRSYLVNNIKHRNLLVMSGNHTSLSMRMTPSTMWSTSLTLP